MEESVLKYQALFVDDDENILNGLKRSLRSLRHSWDMHFALSGPEALKLFENKYFDLIVSDMRMPGMDGAELLEKVHSLSPQTVRVILSGHSEQETVLKTVKLAHQYFRKPTHSDVIKSLMNRVINLFTILRNKNFRELVSSIEVLPCLPDYHVSLMETLESENSSLEDIAELVAKDLGMSSSILKLVNSAFFGFPRPVTELIEAVKWLGLESLKALALTFGLFSVFKVPPTLEAFFDHLMQHSLGTAKLAKDIVYMETGDEKESDLAFLGGLLHDLGKLVLAYIDAEKYLKVLSIVKEKHIPIIEAEHSLFGATHAEVGGYLTGLWGFDLSVVESISFHHHPSATQFQVSSILMAVHVSNSFEHASFAESVDVIHEHIDMAYLKRQNKADRISEWLTLFSDTGTKG